MNADLPVIALTELAGNDISSLNQLQESMQPIASDIVVVWWIVWAITLVIVVRYAIVHGDYTHHNSR